MIKIMIELINIRHNDWANNEKYDKTDDKGSVGENNIEDGEEEILRRR